jgi:hypothetical protein
MGTNSRPSRQKLPEKKKYSKVCKNLHDR